MRLKPNKIEMKWFLVALVLVGVIILTSNSFVECQTTIVEVVDETTNDLESSTTTNLLEETSTVFNYTTSATITDDIINSEYSCFRHQYRCQNGGTCSAGLYGTICTCPYGWLGERCEITYQDKECLDKGCYNGGVCRRQRNEVAYKCDCQDNFSGDMCENGGPTLSPCDVFTCENGGTCHVVNGSYACQCPYGFYGSRCDLIDTHLADMCDDYVCYHESRCVYDSEIRQVHCLCARGTYGRNCEHGQIDRSCTAYTCKNGGTCVLNMTTSSTYCVCANDFYGPACEFRVSCLDKPCMNGGTCVHVGNEHVCQCPYYYHGVQCEKYGSSQCNYNECSNGGICLAYDSSNYECICPRDYLQPDCKNMICSTTSNPCLNGGTCYRTSNISATYCQCTADYYGSVCEKSINSSCKIDGCLNGGTCVLVGNEYVCQCQNYYPYYYGLNCELSGSNPCTSNGCQNGGICVAENATSHVCFCPNGYIGNRCEYVSCESNDCQNGGICYRENLNTYETSCLCSSDYYGRKCEHSINETCQTTGCLNGGTCSLVGTQYVCKCDNLYPNYYHGYQCEIKGYNDCSSSSRCSRNGVCVALGSSGYKCVCSSGFALPDCAHYTCTTNNCENGGTCYSYRPPPRQTSTSCSCPAGFYGSRCESNY